MRLNLTNPVPKPERELNPELEPEPEPYYLRQCLSLRTTLTHSDTIHVVDFSGTRLGLTLSPTLGNSGLLRRLPRSDPQGPGHRDQGTGTWAQGLALATV